MNGNRDTTHASDTPRMDEAWKMGGVASPCTRETTLMRAGCQLERDLNSFVSELTNDVECGPAGKVVLAMVSLQRMKAELAAERSAHAQTTQNRMAETESAAAATVRCEDLERELAHRERMANCNSEAIADFVVECVEHRQKISQLERELAAITAKLNEYRQAAFVLTDMDRDDPQDIVRTCESWLKRIEDGQRDLHACRNELLEAQHDRSAMQAQRDEAQRCLTETMDVIWTSTGPSHRDKLKLATAWQRWQKARDAR